MAFLRRRGGTATSRSGSVGIILLIALAFLAGPNLIPRVFSRLSPYFEGVPCNNLRNSPDRANHQSLLGRDDDDAMQLRIRSSAIPNSGDGFLTLQIIVENNSIGTLAFVYNEDEVSIGDNNTSGLGIIFSPTNSLATTNNRQDSPSFPESEIRLLGPRQRCIHTISIPAGNVIPDQSVTSGTAQVLAYYRGTSRGSVVQPPGAVATPIYPDQGLWVGLAQSEAVIIPPASQ